MDESPGESILYEGRQYKSYRGMGSPNVVVSVVIKLFLEVWILLGKVVCVFKFKDEGHQCLRDETAAIDAEMPGFVWTRTI